MLVLALLLGILGVWFQAGVITIVLQYLFGMSLATINPWIFGTVLGGLIAILFWWADRK